jgi:cold shock protein
MLVEGVVKWYNPVTGIGFITPYQGSHEVLISYSALLSFGIESLRRGARVTVEVENRTKGLRTNKIISVDESELDEIKQSRARVKWYDKNKGYGFLVSTDNLDVFLHGSTLERYKIKPPTFDQEFFIHYTKAPRGFVVTSIREVPHE